MNYQDIQGLILKYAPEMAGDFADRFNRFPAMEVVACKIANFLRIRAEIYRRIEPEVFSRLLKAAAEIERHAGF